MNRLLLTKSNSTAGEIKRISDLGLEVIVQSFIHFEEVEFQLPSSTSYQWIFFSSPRAFNFFALKADFSLLQEKRIACVGRKTAEHIQSKGLVCDFIGQKSGEVDEVAKHLKSLVKEDTILFPISQRSNQSMQKVLKPSQCINLVVYHTLEKHLQLKQQPNLLVFTSPSNAEAYLKHNTINPTQKIIAWGSTTKAYLESKGYTSAFQLEESSIESLYYALKNRPDLLA